MSKDDKFTSEMQRLEKGNDWHLGVMRILASMRVRDWSTASWAPLAMSPT